MGICFSIIIIKVYVLKKKFSVFVKWKHYLLKYVHHSILKSAHIIYDYTYAKGNWITINIDVQWIIGIQ